MPGGIHLRKTFLGDFHVLPVGECWHASAPLGNPATLTFATLAGLLPTWAQGLDCSTIPMQPHACGRLGDVASQAI